MSKQPWQPDDAELEGALRGLAARIEPPVRPDMATAVRRRLATRQLSVLAANEMTPGANHRRPTAFSTEGATGVARGGRLLRRLALAVAALVLLLAATLGVLPGARAALATWLGLRAVTIVYRPAAPTVPAGVVVGTRLGLGQRMLIPAALGVPDEVYMGAASRDEVTLVYHARPGLPRAKETGVGLLLVEHPGSLARGPAVFFKGLAPGGRFEVTSVGGGTAYWFAGAPHLLWYTGGDGQLHQEQVRLAGNVLLWERSGLILRLESALSKDAALRIAASVR